MPVDIVYSSATGRVRKIIIPSAGHPPDSGEDVIIVSDSQYQGFASAEAIQAFVTATIGKTPSGDRYAVLDQSGNVQAAILADPLCGDASPLPGGSLMAHPHAVAGDILTASGVILPNTPMPLRLGIIARGIRRQLNLPLP